MDRRPSGAHLVRLTRVFTWGWMSAQVRATVDNLPTEAGLALQEFMAAVVFDPHSFAPGGSANMPTVEFGPGGRGLVTFLIRDDERELLITQVLWFG